MKNKSTITKIIVVVVIIAIIVGIFIYKKSTTNNPVTDTTKTVTVITNNSNESNNDTTTNSTTSQNTDVKYPLNITSVNLQEIKSYGVPTIIDFGSDGCEPCKQMYPTLVKYNQKYQDKAAIQFMDVWKYADGITDFPIQLIPTQVFFNADGTPYSPSDEIKNNILFDVQKDSETNKPIFTVHQGALTERQFVEILKDMGVE